MTNDWPVDYESLRSPHSIRPVLTFVGVGLASPPWWGEIADEVSDTQYKIQYKNSI